ncbi:hypothetical protein [Ruegeria arenilitoris]|uniref:hypothetical protein n=1 Tax=Ruegeria arenilitoris TaxID=1173585 RepID=UPI00147F774D|nr:hypothetical protein [Ruegeria arenilitoris]
MARRQYYGRGYGHRSRSASLEAALQHIEDARVLSKELGGTDRDVKEYFFSLPQNQLTPLLAEYGRIYGSSAKNYAEKTIPKWRSGYTQMSGTVAERLFKLLPPRMPLNKKYELVGNLWKNLGPKSNVVFTVGYDTPTDHVVDAITTHTDEVIKSFVIPENLENRFKWISAGDVGIRQQLLNHMQNLERQLVLQGVRLQVPKMQEHLSSIEGQHTKSATQEFKVGNHAIRLEFEKEHEGISKGSIRKPSRSISGSSDSGFGWVIWLIVGIAVLYFLG